MHAVRKFNKVAEQKINIHKSMDFIYTRNKLQNVVEEKNPISNSVKEGYNLQGEKNNKMSVLPKLIQKCNIIAKMPTRYFLKNFNK